MNNELYHHGILGMKWGVRRTPEQLVSLKIKKLKTDENGIYTDPSSGERWKIYSKKSSMSKQQKERAIKVGKTLAILSLEIVGSYTLSKVANHYGTKVYKEMMKASNRKVDINDWGPVIERKKK